MIPFDDPQKMVKLWYYKPSFGYQSHEGDKGSSNDESSTSFSCINACLSPKIKVKVIEDRKNSTYFDYIDLTSPIITAWTYELARTLSKGAFLFQILYFLNYLY